jgi:phosphate-selective porin OprO and OprP
MPTRLSLSRAAAALLFAIASATSATAQSLPGLAAPSFGVRFQTTKPKDKPKKPIKAEFTFKDHPALEIGEFTLAFKARLSGDVNSSEAPLEEDAQGVDLARRRIGFEASFGNYVESQVEFELADSEDPWRDVFVNYRQFDFAQFQYGKFKLPFGLDENTSSTNLDFAYRSLMSSQLAPGRDIGWMVHGRVLDKIVRYEFGKFEHDGDNARSRNLERVRGDATTAWRISAQPARNVKSPYADLYVAVSGVNTEVPLGFPGVQGDSVLGSQIWEADLWVQGARKRSGFEFRWRPGPASVKFETIKMTTERLGQSVEDTDLSLLEAKGWYVSGTYAITGEKKADGLENPKRPLFRGGFGAVEAAFRVEKITYGTQSPFTDPPSTSPRADNYVTQSNKVVTFGVNWYANRWVKVQFNFIKETLSDPILGPLPASPAFNSRVLRFQFTL